MESKKKPIILLVVVVIVGSCIGDVLCNILLDRWIPHQAQHVCQCERCKIIRQLEAVEVLDSVIQDRIVININKEK